MLTSTRDVRSTMNDIDKEIRKIESVSQGEIDRYCDRVDSELVSCSRELISTERTLEQIKPLLDRLVLQVGNNAPDAVQVLVSSIATEIENKALTAISNLREVQKNVKDVDMITDKIDEATDKIKEIVKNVDKITDKYQK